MFVSGVGLASFCQVFQTKQQEACLAERGALPFKGGARPVCLLLNSAACTDAARDRMPTSDFQQDPHQLFVWLCCRHAYASDEGGDHPSITAAGKLNMSTEQVSKGLLYRQHILDLLDRSGPHSSPASCRQSTLGHYDIRGSNRVHVRSDPVYCGPVTQVEGEVGDSPA